MNPVGTAKTSPIAINVQLSNTDIRLDSPVEVVVDVVMVITVVEDAEVVEVEMVIVEVVEVVVAAFAVTVIALLVTPPIVAVTTYVGGLRLGKGISKVAIPLAAVTKDPLWTPFIAYVPGVPLTVAPVL